MTEETLQNWVSQHLTESRSGGELLVYPVGYCIISRPDSESIYLEDVFVNPEVRGENWVQWMATQVEDVGRLEGRFYLYGDIQPNSTNSELMHDLMTAFGMRRLWSTPVLDIYRKVING